MLKKALSITTLLGVLFEVAEQASEGHLGSASVAALLGLFLLFWTWDVFKDVGKEKVDKWNFHLYKVLRQTQLLHGHIPAHLTTDDMAEVVHRYCEGRYPVGRDYKTTIRGHEPRNIEVRCSRWARLRLEVKSFPPTDIRIAVLRHTPLLVYWTGFVGIVFVGVSLANWGAGLSDGLEALEFKEATDGLMYGVAILGIVTIPLIYMIVSISARRWFPSASLVSIKGDLLSLLENPRALDGPELAGESLKKELGGLSDRLASVHDERGRSKLEKICMRSFQGLACIWLFIVVGRVVWVLKNPKPETIQDAQQAFKDHDYPHAKKILAPLADKGDLEAQFTLAEMARRDGDSNEATFRYQQAAKQGHPTALYRLGFDQLQDGDRQEGIALLTEAAAKGNRQAQEQLGDVYGNNWSGVKRDTKKSMQYYSMAAEAGDNFAQDGVASLYADAGRFDKAFYWYSVCNKSKADTGELNPTVVSVDGEFNIKDDCGYRAAKMAKKLGASEQRAITHKIDLWLQQHH